MFSWPGKYNAVCSMSPSFVFVYFFLPTVEDLLDVIGEVVGSGLLIFIFGSRWWGKIGVRCLRDKGFGGIGGCG